MVNESILDELMGNSLEDVLKEEFVIPKRCGTCNSATICSVLPTFMSLSKIGIFVSIEACPYTVIRKQDD